MRERTYNSIYEKLVRSEDDLIGLIAYAIYKKHKIEFVSDIKTKLDREPTDEECHAFFVSSTTESQLLKYRNDAQALLSEVVANTTSEELERYESEMLAKYQSNIKQCLPPWWENVLWSVVASFVFSGMGIFFYYMGITQKQSDPSPQSVELKIVHDTIQTNVPLLYDKIGQ